MTKNNKLVNKNWTYFGEIKNGKPNGKGKKEFFVQIKSHLHNFHELSYSDLVIKTINSKDMYLNYD